MPPSRLRGKGTADFDGDGHMDVIVDRVDRSLVTGKRIWHLDPCPL